MGMRKNLIIALWIAVIAVGLGHTLTKAADVEIILGASSAFNVVRGTDVSSGTKMLYVGSSTVSIGTTTQSAMLTIAGSSTDTTGGLRVTNSSGTVTLNVRNDGAVFIGTNTSSLNSALYVGSATSGSLGTITAGFLSMGTISANTGLHGTTTVRFLADIFANGTITATKFSGDGSSLTGITATSLGSTSNINTTGTINAGSTTVSVLTTTGSATVTGTLTAASNNFVVGSTGSMTAASITVAPAGTLTVASGAFKVDETGSMTAARVTASSVTVTTGTLTVASGAFKVDENGSMTASRITSAGAFTAGGSNFAVDATGTLTAQRITVANGTITAQFLSVGTVSTAADGTTTVHFLADIYSPGTVTAARFSGDGSALTGVTATGGVSSGNITIPSGTISAGSTTVSVLTTTGSATVTGTLTAGNSSFTVDGTTGSMTAASITVAPAGTLTVASGAFKVDETGSMTAARVTASSMTVTTGTLTVASGAFKVDENGSMTASRITSAGAFTAGGSNFAVDATGSTTVKTLTVASGSITAANGAFVVDTTGSTTVKTFTSTGSITVSGSGIGVYSGISLGTNTPPSLSLLTIVGSTTASYGTTTPETTLVTIVGSDTSNSYSSLRIIPGTSGAGAFTTLFVRNDGGIAIGTETIPAIMEGTTTAVNAPSIADGSATVYIRGNLYVTGSVTANAVYKGAGAFLIPHPDPEKTGWMLKHCFVESATRGDNLYRFTVEIQSKEGEASVALPSYWKYLNENPQVWVTAVGQFAQGYGYVDEESKKLIIKGEKRGTYNVLLVGTRKDKLAKDFFDAQGVEFEDKESYELLTRGEQKVPDDTQPQLINAINNNGNKRFIDPLDDGFGLAKCR